MKTKLGVVCAFVILMPLCANAMIYKEFYSNGTIQAGEYYDMVQVIDGAVVTMIGGQVVAFNCDNISKLVFSGGEINTFNGFAGGAIEMTGGMCGTIGLACDAMAYVSGGQISGTISGNEGSMLYITGYSLVPNLIVQEHSGWVSGTISGYWQDWTAFNFSISFDNISNIILNEIPEPMTLALAAIGLMFVRRKKK